MFFRRNKKTKPDRPKKNPIIIIDCNKPNGFSVAVDWPEIKNMSLLELNEQISYLLSSIEILSSGDKDIYNAIIQGCIGNAKLRKERFFMEALAACIKNRQANAAINQLDDNTPVIDPEEMLNEQNIS